MKTKMIIMVMDDGMVEVMVTVNYSRSNASGECTALALTYPCHLGALCDV